MAIAQTDQIHDQAIIDSLNTCALGSAGLAAGSTSTLSTAVAFHYKINGQVYYKAAATNVAPTALAAQANGTTAYYLVCVNAAGTTTLVAPPAARTGSPATTNLLLGALPAGFAPIGIAKVVATAAFTWGTTSLGTQVTFANICNYPANGDPTGFTYA